MEITKCAKDRNYLRQTEVKTYGNRKFYLNKENETFGAAYVNYSQLGRLIQEGEELTFKNVKGEDVTAKGLRNMATRFFKARLFTKSNEEIHQILKEMICVPHQS